MPSAPRRRTLTMVELMIALAIFSTAMGLVIMAFQTFRGRPSENLSKRLILQTEARKGLVNLYRYLQEGIEVVAPPPGTTMPYLVFKDAVNDLRMVYLEKDPRLSQEEERTIYKAMTVVRDPLETAPDSPKTLMQNVLKLNFTPYSRGSVLISAQLRGGKGDFSLLNFVRLQNTGAEEDL